MMGSLLMVVLAAGTGGSADALVKFQAKALKLSVPAAWERSNQEGTEKFKAPSGDAFFLLDVGAVQAAGMKPEVCLEKILTAMGGGEWEKLKLGSHPAARRVNVDAATEDGSDKLKTLTYVGCNGKTTWSLIFTMNEKKQERFEPLAKKITESVSYAKGK